MKKVIISFDREILTNFLQGKEEKYLYLSVDYSPEMEDILKSRGYKEVKISNGLNGIDFRKEYISFIGRLNRDNNSLHWWLNTLSYKGTYPRDLSKDIFNYYCIMGIIKKGDSNYIIINNDFIFNKHIKAFCDKNNIWCKILDNNGKEGSFLYFKRWFMHRLCFICGGWMRKMLVSLFLSKRIKESINKEKPYYILRTWINERSFLANGNYKDIYFGSLPEYLKNKGIDFIILSGILTGYRELFWKIKKINEFLIVPQEYFIGYMDYIKVLIIDFIKRPKIRGPLVFCGLDVADFLKGSLKRDREYNETGKNLMYYYYAKGLLRKVKAGFFTYSFENQSWERMSIFALRAYSPSTRIIGYAHSSFRPFLFRYLCSKEEKDIVPLPDKIITVGREFKDILAESANYNGKVELSEGCALRYEHIFSKHIPSWNKDGSILVALSMDFSRTLRLLRFLSDALSSERYKNKVVLRSHPFMPVEILLACSNIALRDNFSISRNPSLDSDLIKSSLMIYDDTTSSMEALMRGVPVIHVDAEGAASSDPLFRLNSLKWTVSRKDELFRSIDYIYNMDEREYIDQRNKAVAYMKQYFYPIEDKYLEEFIR